MKKFLTIIGILCLGLSSVLAQTVQVSGTVTSADDGQPLPGVSVVVKGTMQGTVTDSNGKYSLSAPQDATLVFSFVGMATQEIPARDNRVLDVVLESSRQAIDEVVVVAYGTQRRSAITGAAAVVSKEKIESGTREALDKALSGKLAGVRVSSSTGDPGSAGEISIRGIGSFSASSSPLYVIDGVVIDAGNDVSTTLKSSSLMATINPDDIESVTVLKDAAAASLYGSRAANGVILITTKKGREGKTTVGYRGEFGMTKMAVKQYEPAGAASTIDYYREGMANYYLYYGDAATKEEAYELVASEGDLEYFFTDPSGKTDTNWWDEVYKTSFTQDHQVYMSGGNEKTKLYGGFGYNDAEGIVAGSDFKRYSGRLNLDHNIGKHFDVSLRQGVSKINQNGFRDQNDQAQGLGTSSPLSILFAMDPTAKVYNDDGTINNDAGWGKISNPISMLNGSDAEREFVKIQTFRSITNGELLVTIMPELTFKSIVGYDYVTAQQQEFWSPTSVNGANLGGLGYRVTMTKQTLTSSNIFRYAKTFAEKHNFNAFVGLETEKSNLLQIVTSTKSYSTDKLPELANGQPYDASSGTYGSTILSYLANVNYDYNNTYYLAASFRRDGSSRLGIDNRWANFYSVSAAWRLSKAGFLSDMPLFHDLKLRASYGTNGNLPSSYYANLALYSFSGGYGSESAIFWSQPGNVELGWEKSNNFNIGIDWNMYDRVRASVEYYNKRTTSLLFEVPSSYVTGFAETWQNLGKILNNGIEVELSSKNIQGEFIWNTDFNFTWQKTKISELPGGNDVPYGDGNMYILKEGESMHSFYLPVWKGVDPATGLGQFLVDPNDESKGTTPVYSQAGKTVVGKALPDFIGGLTNTFMYKGFDLSFLITYQFGGDLFDYPGYFLNSDGVRMGTWGILKEVENNYWKNPGDVVDNPKPIYGNPYRPDRWSSRRILSTDNIRLRELSVGYSVPVKNIAFLQGTVSNLRVYCKANNLAMLWIKTKGIEPDVPLNGYRQVDTPVTKSIVFGINVEF